MRQFYNYIKAGVKEAPALLLVCYYFFILTDLLTTYLATPDLKHEGNWIVRLLQLNWKQIILWVIFGALFLSLLFSVSFYYVKRIFQKYISATNTKLWCLLYCNRKLLLSYIIIGYFFKHLFYSVFVTFNNYLGYIFISKNENWLYKFSLDYFKFESKHYPCFFPFLHLIILIASYLFVYWYLVQLKKRIESRKFSTEQSQRD